MGRVYCTLEIMSHQNPVATSNYLYCYCDNQKGDLLLYLCVFYFVFLFCFFLCCIFIILLCAWLFLEIHDMLLYIFFISNYIFTETNIFNFWHKIKKKIEFTKFGYFNDIFFSLWWNHSIYKIRCLYFLKIQTFFCNTLTSNNILSLTNQTISP